MESDIMQLVQSLGPSGLMALACLTLWRRNVKLQDKINDIFGELIKSIEK